MAKTDKASQSQAQDPQKLVDQAMAEAQASINDLQKVAEEAAGPKTAGAPAAGGAEAAKGAGASASGGGGGGGGPKRVEVPDLTSLGQALAAPAAGGAVAAAEGGTSKGIDLLSDVDLHVTIELGRTQMLVEDVLNLGTGSVVELDKLAGDPVDVYVNHRLVARGEVLVLNDNFCIRVSEIVADLEEQAQEAAQELVEAKPG